MVPAEEGVEALPFLTGDEKTGTGALDHGGLRRSAHHGAAQAASAVHRVRLDAIGDRDGPKSAMSARVTLAGQFQGTRLVSAVAAKNANRIFPGPVGQGAWRAPLKGQAMGGGRGGEPFALEPAAIAHGRLARGVYSRQARAPCHACRDGPNLKHQRL